MSVAYDGGRYLGWQRQGPGEGERTIQGKLEAVLSRMAGGEPIAVIGASRTDAGVHALNQTANFHTAGLMPLAEMEAYLSRYLPEDIQVQALEEADPRFHARYLARRKRYEYRIVNRRQSDLFLRRYTLHVPQPLDLAAMGRAAAALAGEHDFSSFTTRRSRAKSAVRRIDGIRLLSGKAGEPGWAGALAIEYEGNGFLHNMIRIMTGTLLEAGAGRLDPGELPAILAARRRERAGPMAPARGLFLVEVMY